MMDNRFGQNRISGGLLGQGNPKDRRAASGEPSSTYFCHSKIPLFPYCLPEFTPTPPSLKARRLRTCQLKQQHCRSCDRSFPVLGNATQEQHRPANKYCNLYNKLPKRCNRLGSESLYLCFIIVRFYLINTLKQTTNETELF
jgi:hypothetical protein